METPPELPAVMAIADRGVRRAALEGLRPGLVGLADSAALDPTLLAHVEDEWLPAALSCLERGAAERAVALDGRSCAGQALVEVHGVEAVALRLDLGSRPVGSVTSVELRQWVLDGVVDVGAAVGYARRAQEAQYLVSVLVGLMSRPRRSDADVALARELFVEVFWDHCTQGCGDEVAWGQLSELVPPAWWQLGRPANSHVVSMLWEGPLGPGQLSALLDAAPLDADAARWVLARAPHASVRAQPFLFGDQLVLLDRALRTAGGPVPSFTMRPEELLGALGYLGPGPLHDYAVGELLSGAWGAVQDERMVPAVVALDPAPEQVAEALGPWLLAEWAVLVDDTKWRDVLALMHHEAVDNAVSSTVWGDDEVARRRFVAAAVDVVPGMLLSLSDWGEECISEEVMVRLVEGLGDDALAWQALWQLAPRWPGTVSAALDCVRACHQPPG